MNLNEKFCKLTHFVGDGLTKRSPELLTATAIASFLLSTYLAVKATPKAEKMIKEKKEELKVEKLSPIETVKTVGKEYLPSASAAVTGIILSNASVSVSKKRIVALSTSYEILREASRTYRDKVIETIGERKEEKIQHEINQDKVDKNVPESNVNIYMPKEDGTYRTLIYEPLTNNYFWDNPSNFDAYVGRAQKIISNSFDGELSVYTWLTLLPKELLDGFPDGLADRYMNIGWAKDTPYEGFNAELGDSVTIHGGKWDGYPCRVIRYDDDPIPSFRNF